MGGRGRTKFDRAVRWYRTFRCIGHCIKALLQPGVLDKRAGVIRVRLGNGGGTGGRVVVRGVIVTAFIRGVVLVFI